MAIADHQPRNRIAVLGSTGSIGTSCLDVIAAHSDRLELAGITAHDRWKSLAEQSHRFRPRWAVVSNADHRPSVQPLQFPQGTELQFGSEAVERLAAHADVDTVVCGIVGDELADARQREHLRTVFGDECLGAFDEGVVVELVEGVPRRERRRIDDLVEEQQSVQVVDFMLVGAGGQATDLVFDVVAVPIPCLHGDPRVALHLAADARHRQAPLDRKSTRLNSSHIPLSRMPASA